MQIKTVGQKINIFSGIRIIKTIILIELFEDISFVETA